MIDKVPNGAIGIIGSDVVEELSEFFFPLIGGGRFFLVGRQFSVLLTALCGASSTTSGDSA